LGKELAQEIRRGKRRMEGERERMTTEEVATSLWESTKYFSLEFFS